MAVATSGAQIPVGSSAALTLPWPIGAYIVGVRFFQFVFPSSTPTTQDYTKHAIHEIGFSLSANMTGADTIAVTANGTMKDSSGHHLDPSSSLCVSALAWSQDDINVAEVTAPGIPNGTASPPVPIPPGSAVLASQAILTGFDLAYSSADHNVQTVQAAVSSNLFFPPAASIAGIASLQDASGDVATTATVDGAYFCSFNVPELDLATWVGTTQTPVDTQNPVTVHFATPPTSVALFLTGFSIAFPDGTDNQIAYIVAGGTQLSPGASTTFIPQAAMATGNPASNPTVATGTVSVVAVGLA